ncbi:MAG: hypothetical protein M3023_04975 [Pseudomonadota bacterium]|nr:hypothetical protein [Pseudomonadota bacterium]
MWFLYFLPILVVIPFRIVQNRRQGKAAPRSIVLGLALIVAVGAAGFAAVELMR